MRVVLTGGLGFIGSHVAEKIAAEGVELLIIDHGCSPKWVEDTIECAILRACVTSKKAADAILAFRPHCIIHLAAQVNVATSVIDPLSDLRANIAGTVNLLAAAHKVKASCFIFASSGGAVYGDQCLRPTKETAVVAPVNPYGLSKLSAEMYLNWYAAQGDLRCVNLRFANVYGPRQGACGEGGVIGIFARKLAAGGHLVCFGDGQQTRDFVYVDCVARAVVNSVFDERAIGTINIASGTETSIEEAARLMTRLAGVKSQVRFEKERSNEVRYSCLDNTRARERLEWVPAFSFAQGCEAVLSWAHAGRQDTASFRASAGIRAAL